VIGLFAGLLDSDEVGALVCSARFPAMLQVMWSAQRLHPVTVRACVAQFLVINDGSPSVPDQLRRMMAWEPIGGLAIFWRCRHDRQEVYAVTGSTRTPAVPPDC
jgi:hypothetical protein